MLGAGCPSTCWPQFLTTFCSPPLSLPCPHRLPLAVEPSTLPVALQLLRDGTPLPTRVVEGEDGPSQVAVLEGLPAGSSGAGRILQLLSLWVTGGLVNVGCTSLALCTSSPSALPPFSAAASGLKVALLDESGQPAAHEVAGKVTLSWRSGSKKVTWGAQASTATPGIKLPPAKVGSEMGARTCTLLAHALASYPQPWVSHQAAILFVSPP